jgi:hypothetical protein
VVVNIEHEHDNWGNIYVSDRFGGNFSLSLRHNPVCTRLCTDEICDT